MAVELLLGGQMDSAPAELLMQAMQDAAMAVVTARQHGVKQSTKVDSEGVADPVCATAL